MAPDQMNNFPRLTELKDYPLHGWDYDDDYACQRPEDPLCQVFDWRCPNCLLMAQASLNMFGDSDVEWRQDASTDEQSVKLSWLIDRAIYWMGQAL